VTAWRGSPRTLDIEAEARRTNTKLRSASMPLAAKPARAGGQHRARTLALGLAMAVSAGCTEQISLPSASLLGGAGGSGGRGSRGEGGSGGYSGLGGTGGIPVVSDGGGAETGVGGCSDISDVRQLTPQVVITLDRSSSMGKKYGTSTQTRLQIVQDTLRSVMKSYQASIDFGYVEFPVKENCAANTCCASQIIPPNQRALSVIEKRWACELGPPACSETTADSPVVEALRQARWFFVDERTGPTRHVLLLTDGEPSCAFNKDQSACSLALTQVSRLSVESHVSTRVFGLAEELRGSSCLDMMAGLGTPGSTGQQPNATPRITTTGDQLYDELLRWFEPLSKEACTFRLPYVLPAGQKLTVLYEGKPVPRDPEREDGWELSPDSARRVVFYGPACDRLRTAAVGETEFSTCAN
jgi:hypothetical protein